MEHRRIPPRGQSVYNNEISEDHIPTLFIDLTNLDTLSAFADYHGQEIYQKLRQYRVDSKNKILWLIY
jgi:hypothetical protein